MKHTRTHQGFTLIELSIVLVIISLVVVGIISGKSLIHTATLQTAIGDLQEFKAAYHLYQNQYNAKPGDHRNAYEFFSVDGDRNCGRDDTTTSGCNGDGNQQITASFTGENLKAWQHLQQAGIITGRVKSEFGTGARYHNPTTDPEGTGNSGYTPSIPASKIKGNFIGYSFTSTNHIGRDGALFGQVGHLIMLGGDSLGASAYNSGPSVNAADARSIDNKMDDGKPDSGKLFATSTHSVPGSCTTNGAYWNANATSTSDYVLSDSTISCLISYLIE